MINELVKIGDNGERYINGRDLRDALEVQRQFANWMPDNLEMFSEGQDYRAFNVNVKCQNGIGSSRRKEYSLTLETAKHIALMSRTEIGKKIRQEIIELEKKYSENGFVINPNATVQQQLKAVDELSILKTRGILDCLREITITKVTRYLAAHGYTEKQTSALLASVHNHVHVAVKQKIASRILYDIVEQGLDKDSIKSANQMRTTHKIRKCDYRAAINFYEKEDLETFIKYYDYIMKAASFAIESKFITCTPELVKSIIEEESRKIVRNYTSLQVGDVLPGVNRKAIDKMINTLYTAGFEISDEEKQIMLDEVADKSSRSYVVK